MIQADEWSERDRGGRLRYALARARAMSEDLPLLGLPVWMPPGEEAGCAEDGGKKAVGSQYVASLFVTVDHDGYYEIPFSIYLDGLKETITCHPMDEEIMAHFRFSPWLTQDPTAAGEGTETFLAELRENLTLVSRGCSVSNEEEVERSGRKFKGIGLVVEMDLSLAGPEWDLPALAAERLHQLVRLVTSLDFLVSAKRALGPGRAARRFSAEEVRSLHRGMPGEIILPGCRNARGGASAVDGQ